MSVWFALNGKSYRLLGLSVSLQVTAGATGVTTFIDGVTEVNVQVTSGAGPYAEGKMRIWFQQDTQPPGQSVPSSALGFAPLKGMTPPGLNFLQARFEISDCLQFNLGGPQSSVAGLLVEEVT